jgi:hypothetical protein
MGNVIESMQVEHRLNESLDRLAAKVASLEAIQRIQAFTIEKLIERLEYLESLRSDECKEKMAAEQERRAYR